MTRRQAWRGNFEVLACCACKPLQAGFKCPLFLHQKRHGCQQAQGGFQLNWFSSVVSRRTWTLVSTPIMTGASLRLA